MHPRLRAGPALLVVAFSIATPLSAQPVARRVAVEPITNAPTSHFDPTIAAAVAGARTGQAAQRRVPRWARWGLVGAAAGAVVFPLVGGLGGDSESNAARDAAAGALSGFVIIGGSVALWDAVCAGDTRSRRAGLCGRR